VYKSVIFYFSGTGNTWWVADRIKKQLDARNINADTVSIDTVDAKKANWWIKTADLVFFGWPVYFSYAPEPMKRFVDNLLPIEKGKHIHVFCTQAVFSGDGAWVLRKSFKEKGLIIDSAQHFIMPSNKKVYSGDAGAAKAESIMEACGSQVDRYVEGLLIGKARIMGKNSFALGAMQRAPFGMFSKSYKRMGVDKTKCTRCGVCAQLCPSGNISMSDYPEFADKCSHCLRCYAFCPVNAVTCNGKPFDTQKYGKPYVVHDKRFKPSLLK
jgi:flavodoxin/Pyruvate/2-oxoacid:ferredoxin oxidoreductase delta subunit